MNDDNEAALVSLFCDINSYSKKEERRGEMTRGGKANLEAKEG